MKTLNKKFLFYKLLEEINCSIKAKSKYQKKSTFIVMKHTIFNILLNINVLIENVIIRCYYFIEFNNHIVTF